MFKNFNSSGKKITSIQVGNKKIYMILQETTYLENLSTLHLPKRTMFKNFNSSGKKNTSIHVGNKKIYMILQDTSFNYII